MSTQTKEKKSEVPGTVVLTPEFRLSYPFLFTPRDRDAEGKPLATPKYSIQMIFRVGGQPAEGEKVVDIKDLRQAAMLAASAEWGHDSKKWPTPFNSPFRDGGKDRADKSGYGPGTVFVTATGIYKPGVVDQQVKDIIDANAIYPGCYCRAQIAAYTWKHTGKYGVSFGLRHVQLLRDGEPLGGGTRAADAFDPIPMPAGGAAGAAAPAAAGGDNPFGGL